MNPKRAGSVSQESLRLAALLSSPVISASNMVGLYNMAAKSSALAAQAKAHIGPDPKDNSMTTWSKSMDEHLYKMARMGMTSNIMAVRLGVTPKEVIERCEILNHRKREEEARHAAEAEKSKPTTEENTAALKVNMNHAQAAFTDAALRFNQLGEHMKVFADLVSHSLHEEELSKVIEAYWDEPKKDKDESTSQKLARLMCASFVVMQKPVQFQPPNGPTTPPTS